MIHDSATSVATLDDRIRRLRHAIRVAPSPTIAGLLLRQLVRLQRERLLSREGGR